MQYTLAGRIPSHPTLSNFEVSWYGHWTICSWVCESGGKNKVSNTSDKPPSWVHHLPAGSITRFTRVRVRELKNAHNSVTVQNRTHVYMNFFDHKDLRNHLLQLCPKVVKHPVYSVFRNYIEALTFRAGCTYSNHRPSEGWTRLWLSGNLSFIAVT